MNIDCEFFKDGKCSACQVLAKNRGFDTGGPVKVSEKHCEGCLKSSCPKQENDFMIYAINAHYLKQARATGDKKLFQEWTSNNTKVRLEKQHGKENIESLDIQKKRQKELGEGVGTELNKLIPSSLEYKGCKCKDYALKMNRWGVNGCEKRFNIIVDHLVRKSKTHPLMGWVPEIASRIAAESLVKRAITNYKKKEGSIVVASKEKFNWFVAVTTAPRKDNKINQCLDSMVMAGFDPFVFAEPDSEIPGDYDRVVHKKKKGVWHNFLYSVQYALDNTDSDVIMTVQDDSLFHPDSKRFAESILWPHEDTGFVSLYTPKQYSLKPRFKTAQRDPGVNRIYTRSMWGACALIWPRQVLEDFVKHETAKNWIGAPTKTRNSKVMQRRRENPDIVANSDTAIGKIMNSMGKHMYFVDPSPVKHIAQHSTISHGGNTGRRNCSRCASWKESLFNQVPVDKDYKPVKLK